MQALRWVCSNCYTRNVKYIMPCDAFVDPSDLAAGGDIRPACMMFSRTGQCSLLPKKKK